MRAHQQNAFNAWWAKEHGTIDSQTGLVDALARAYGRAIWSAAVDAATHLPEAGKMVGGEEELRGALQELYDDYCSMMKSEFDFPGRPWTPERDGGDHAAIRARTALATRPAPEVTPASTDDTWPIAKLVVADDKIVSASFYTPGLPDGDHDVYPAPVIAPQVAPIDWGAVYEHKRQLLNNPSAIKDSDLRAIEKSIGVERTRTSDEEYIQFYPSEYSAFVNALESLILAAPQAVHPKDDPAALWATIWRLRADLKAAQAVPAEPVGDIGILLTALRFYAGGDHAVLDEDHFDTCSGEPQNWKHHDEESTMVEDGEVARRALRGLAVTWVDGDDDTTPSPLPGELDWIAREAGAQAVPAEAVGVRDCETCEGKGTLDMRLSAYSDSDPKAECPDCNGNGFWLAATPPAEAAAPSGAVPTVPNSLMVYITAYGDARSDDDGTSATRMGELITAMRQWAKSLATPPQAPPAPPALTDAEIDAVWEATPMGFKSVQSYRRFARSIEAHVRAALNGGQASSATPSEQQGGER